MILRNDLHPLGGQFPADLLAELARLRPSEQICWGDWLVRPVLGGQNNLLYQASGPAGDVAVKFTIRDARDRAGREYNTLLVLQRAGLSCAPVPLLLDRDSYAQPLVVQTWLPGACAAAPPTDDSGWEGMLLHYAQIHSITPDMVSIELPAANTNMASVLQGRAMLDVLLARLPAADRPPELLRLYARLDQIRWPDWPAPVRALCRVDPNISNFMIQDGVWRSVDWENSGWGDPAFEIVDMITHPAYAAVSQSRWEWVIARYCELRGDPQAHERIQIYTPLMLIWWVLRFALLLFDDIHGRDQRLAARPSGWRETMETRYSAYLAHAERAVESLAAR